MIPEQKQIQENNEETEEWKNLTINVNDTNNNSFYRKNGNNVELSLGIGNTNGFVSLASWTPVIIATLPEEYRPKKQLSKYASVIDTDNNTINVQFTIRTNGEIFIMKTGNNTSTAKNFVNYIQFNCK